MQVRLIKKDGKSKDYYLTLIPKSKREKRVVRAVKLALSFMRPVIGDGPDGGSIHFDCIPNPAIKEKDKLDNWEMPAWNTPYETQQRLILDRKLQEDIEYQKAIHSDAIAKQYGLHKIVPKKDRAKFRCICGLKFKDRPRMRRHELLCAAVNERLPVIEYALKCAANIKKEEQRRARESNQRKAKNKTRKRIPNKPNAKNKVRAKSPKKAKRRSPVRHKH